MRLSTKGEYGLRAMVALAVRYNEGPVPLREIAEAENISFPYLEQIFPVLRRAGLVNSLRGSRGGYLLARPPDRICVGEIVRTLEGPIVPVDCISEEAGGRNREQCCPRSESCLTRNVWESLRDRINDFLDGITLEDITAGMRNRPAKA